MKKPKIIIDLIMNNSCNRSCLYCPIKFDGRVLEKDDIDFVINYLDQNKDTYEELTINFFGGEPLINFENIKFFLENNKNKKIKYSIGTNGILLTEKKLDFLIKNKVTIFLTFHADKEKTYKKILKNKYIKKGFHLIQINFIVSPINLEYVYEKIDETVKFGFQKINIIPVMLTIKWDKKSIIGLNKFINYVDQKYINTNNYPKLKIYKFSYFDGVPIELGFVLDTNLNIYLDSSDELFIGKNFGDLGEDLIKKIEDNTLLGNIKKIKSFKNIIDKYNIKQIVKLVHMLPKKLGYLKDYALVYRIMNKANNKRSKMGGNIYNILTKDI